MKLFLISQDVNNGYDTYDSLVVAAESEEEAKKLNPSSCATHFRDGIWYGTYSGGKDIGKEYVFESSSWCSFDQVKVELIGTAKKGTKKGIILSSFNAG